MMRSTTVGVFLALSSIFLAGCSGETARKGSEPLTRSYDIKGKVVSVDPKKPAITLDHEDVPGLMKAMEMEFDVENAKILEGIKPGDQVKGELMKKKSGYLITQLEKR
jgi:Cu/Ag efflux protein CusF